MGNVIKTQHQAEQPRQSSKVDSTRSFGGFGKTLLSSGANLAFGALGAQISGSISDYYNQKSEERMDKRNRQLILDTPSLTTEGRRRAGLNPYGDPILPGMSSQSSTDTSDVAPNSFYEAQQMTLQERIALTQLENETKEANARARNLDADSAYKEDLLAHEMPLMEWLGKQASASRDLSSAKYYDQLAENAKIMAEWERKSQDERLELIKSEKNRNEAIAKYNAQSAIEKQAMNTQLDKWIELLPEQKRAELNAELAKTQAIKDQNERDENAFWLKLGALVAGGICCFIPGGQAIGVGLISGSVAASL